MDAKEYLMQVRRLNARLKVINSTIERLRDDINSLSDVSIKSTWPDGQPHGTKITDPTGTSALRILDATEEKRQQLREELLRYEYEQISAHSNSLRTMRFLENAEHTSVFDELGLTASDAIEYLLRLLDDAELAAQWKEIGGGK